MNVAVLGLGRMGRALAGRLIDGGHDVTVWNRSPGRTAELLARGATESQSASEAVQQADVAIVSLSGDDAVREVLLPAGKPIPDVNAVVVDCSTVAPTTTDAEAEGYPGHFVACPIAGAPQAVEAGSALLIVGGTPQAIERATGALDAISTSRVAAGEDPGKAAVIKIVNNYLLLGGLAVLADAVAVAQASGFADGDLPELFGTLPVVAPGLKNRIGGLASGDHEPWFTVELGSKDLGLFADIASAGDVHAGLADALRSRYREAVDLGLGERDLTAVIETVRHDGTAH